MGWTFQQYQKQADEAAKARQDIAAQAAAPDPALANVPGAVDRPGAGWAERTLGTANRFVTGLAQGEVDPAFGTVSLFGGPDLKLDPGGQAEAIARGTLAGRTGRTIGQVVNPSWLALGPLDVLGMAGKYAGPVERFARPLAAKTAQGTIAGAVMPGKDRAGQAETGAIVGAILGLPGATVRGLSFNSVQDAIRSLEEKSPRLVKSLMDTVRELNMPSFNQALYEYMVAPIKGKVPGGTGPAAMRDIETQIGNEIDRSTAAMSFVGAPTRPGVAPHPAMVALDNRQLAGVTRLRTEGVAGTEYEDTINKIFRQPLANAGYRLNGAQLRAVTSDLQTAIRAIRGRKPSIANRALADELETFRMEIFQQAVGTPGAKAAWANAREAWRRFAVGRGGTPIENNPFGRFSPETVKREIGERDRYGVISGRARDQDIIDAANQALALPGRAARDVIRGRQPLSQVVRPFAVPGAAAVTAQQWQPGQTEQGP